MKRVLVRELLLAVVMFISLVSLSWAEFRITPSISIREEYNDNIFLTNTDEEEDFITTINPSLNLTYNTSILTLALDYGLDFKFYVNNSDRNQTSLSNTQRARLDTTISAYRDIFFIKIFDEYKRVPIDERRQIAYDNIFVNMTDSNTLLINPYFEYPITQTIKARIAYTYENIWYKEEEGDDSENHLAQVSLSKEWTPLFSTTVSYSYSAHRPEDTEEYDQHNVFLSAAYQVTPRLSLNGGLGYRWMDYELNEDNNGTTWNVQAGYLLSDFFTVSAAYSKNVSNSINSGAYENERVSGTLSYTGKVPVSLTAFQGEGKYLSLDRRDKSKGVSVSSSLPITSKLNGSIRASYTKNDFSSIDTLLLTDPRFPFFIFLIPVSIEEDVDRYSFGVSFAYALRITTLGFGYTYNQSNSSSDENDFKNNIVWVQARFTL